MKFTVEGAKELKVTIKNMGKAIEPSVAKMGNIARVLVASVDKTFATDGRGTWKPNAPSTIEGVPGILQLTGRLRASIEPRVSKSAAEVKPSNAVYKYGSVNHYGSKSGRIPARPFMKIYPEDITEIMRVLAKPIDEAMKK